MRDMVITSDRVIMRVICTGLLAWAVTAAGPMRSAAAATPGLRLRGSGVDFVQASAMATGGTIIVVGQTFSSDFPVTSGAYDTTHNSPAQGDAFVARIRTNPFRIEAATFFGGSRQDSAQAVAVASDGSVYVAGDTTSTDMPVTSGAYDRTRSGTDREVWVAKFNGDLSTLQACTYLGGSGYDAAFSLALDGNTRVIVAGQTESADFPTTSSAYRRIRAGGKDGFVSVLNTSLTTLNASTFLGGAAEDLVYASAVKGDTYIVGQTKSHDFPTTVGALNRKGQTRPQVAVGSYHTVGLKSDGTVVATGIKDGTNVTGWGDIIQVAAGTEHTVGLKRDGRVVAVGANAGGQTLVSSWTNIIQVAAGSAHTVGLKSDGTVVAVGVNSGASGVSTWANIVQVDAGAGYSLGLARDGRVVTTGSSPATNVTAWASIVQVAAGGEHAVGLKRDGTVVATGMNTYGQTNVTGWANIIQVAAGDNFTLGLRSDGTVAFVGSSNGGGSLVSTWTNIVQVDARACSVGLKNDGTAVAAGVNHWGEASVSTWALGARTWDAFVARFHGDLSTLVASTFLGYNNHDLAYTILCHHDSHIFVGGETCSSDFPTTSDSYGRSGSGQYDAFVLSLDSTLSRLFDSTLIGGSDFDTAYALAEDASGDIMVAGDTYSAGFPTTANAFSRTRQGTSDAFVVNLDRSLESLDYATFAGGTGGEYLYAVLSPASDTAYLAGTTYSTNFPAATIATTSALIPDGFLQEVSTVMGNFWDNGHQSLGIGWRRLDWFGDYILMKTDGWLWHNQHGYLFVQPAAPPHDIWFYTLDMGWWWTSSTLYPYIYRASPAAWLWYSGGTNPRWFRNLTTGQWEAWP